MPENWFWWLMTMACVGWYSTVTVYVAIKGTADIKHMLARLSAKHAQTSAEGESTNPRAPEPPRDRKKK